MSSSTTQDFLLKLLLIGDSGVGKTSLLTRFADGTFQPIGIPTIGVDFKIQEVTVDGLIFKLQIWDTAGQERFRNITTTYYRGCHGVLLCFDVTKRESFENLDMWLTELQRHAPPDVVIILVGNKCDLVEGRKVSTEEGQQYADKIGATFVETSAKTNHKVEEAMVSLTKEFKKKMLDKNMSWKDPKRDIVAMSSVTSRGQSVSKKKGCC